MNQSNQSIKVTTKCGVVDMSYKGKIEIRGPDSEKFIDGLITNAPPGFGGIL